MTREEGIKKFTEIVNIVKGKTIFTDESGNMCAPPDPYDYCIDDLMIFNHGKLEAYKSVLKMFEDDQVQQPTDSEVQRAIDEEKGRLKLLTEIAPVFGIEPKHFKAALDWDMKIHKIKIAALEQMQDKEPCDQCVKWSQTIHRFCPGCGRELSK